jgi:hypothetical protein
MNAPLSLSPRAQRAFDRMASDFQRVLGPRFVALLASSQTASVAFARELGGPDFEALGVLVETWHREGLRTPLVMTPDEFRRSLDTFALEYQTILDRHVVVAGESPIAGARIEPDDLRRACEVQAKGHLIHLRQGWLQAAGHADRVADLIARSAEPFRTVLVNIARLSGASPQNTDELVEFAERQVGMPGDLVRDVLALEAAPEKRDAMASRMGAYVLAADRLWAFVDAWRSP